MEKCRKNLEPNISDVFQNCGLFLITDSGRQLKVALCENGDSLELLTAYDPDEKDLKYYAKLKEKNVRE